MELETGPKRRHPDKRWIYLRKNDKYTNPQKLWPIHEQNIFFFVDEKLIGGGGRESLSIVIQ